MISERLNLEEATNVELNVEEATNVEIFYTDMLATMNAEKLLTEEAANTKNIDAEQQPVETEEKTQGNSRPN